MPLPLLYLGAYLLKKIIEGDNSSQSKPAPDPPPPVLENKICMIGRASSGKSSTANALLGCNAFKIGVEHGVTTRANTADYKNGFKIVDTPGLLDSSTREYEIVHFLRRSRMIVYVTEGQLYQKELDFIARMKKYYWAGQELVVFVNKQDIRENLFTTDQRANEEIAIYEQVKGWIARERLVFGASSPVMRGLEQPARIEALKTIVNKFIGYAD